MYRNGQKYLGEHFDIHGGGMDLIFPHHECEIAQSVASQGDDMVHYWMHNNMITINGQKMGNHTATLLTWMSSFTVLTSYWHKPTAPWPSVSSSFRHITAVQWTSVTKHYKQPKRIGTTDRSCKRSWTHHPKRTNHRHRRRKRLTWKMLYSHERWPELTDCHRPSVWRRPYDQHSAW